jgi:hypothetical protein
MQKARGQSDDGRSRRPSSHRLSAHGFRIYFTRHLACFSPFPHGTGSLSVTREYLALEGGPPRFAQDFTCPALLGIPLGVSGLRVPGCHRLWRAFPCRFGSTSDSHVAVPQPRSGKPDRFGLVPVRSPLLGESRLLSLPPGTEMFQFPGLASACADPGARAPGGCPIRRSRDHGLCAAPPGLSQLIASFVASSCQGIHRAPFVA